ncbi:conserved hypothetical protein [Vibrio coralliirubri]|uniref:Uncharacterized protein n=1 Tax=Vibrio coralliirubri TaxID=1516159 RepID=A0AA86XCS1_9VIBR|nr:conserved hypothetical protein [Vibrio coralliirubri]
MDKELLAKKLYCKRVNSLARGTELDGHVLDEMWESKTSPTDAAKAIQPGDNHLKVPLGCHVISVENKNDSLILTSSVLTFKVA